MLCTRSCRSRGRWNPLDSGVGKGKVEAGQPEEGVKYCQTAIQTAGTIKDMGFPFMAYEGTARGLIALQQSAEAKQVLDEAIGRASRFGKESSNPLP
jgi:hypothetical protein